MRFTRGIGWGGAVLALAVAVALFTRFSFDDTMRRDEAIYAYGGQQLAAGVPLYRGIFDPKTPVAQALAGAAAALAPGRGFADVHAIRVAFFVAACLSVVAVYWLGLVLWGSPLAALLGATGFASFRSFALDAVGGPDAKTPGILFAVVALALLVRRRWFWARWRARSRRWCGSRSRSIRWWRWERRSWVDGGWACATRWRERRCRSWPSWRGCGARARCRRRAGRPARIRPTGGGGGRRRWGGGSRAAPGGGG